MFAIVVGAGEREQSVFIEVRRHVRSRLIANEKLQW